MGCDTYYLYNDTRIRFSESDDEFGCLCTFPHNNNYALCKDDVMSLAMLGAAVVLAKGNDKGENWVYLPYDIPDWIVDELKRILK